MKNKIIFIAAILFLFLFLFPLHLSAVKLINSGFETNYFLNFSEYRGKVAVIADIKDNPGFFTLGRIFMYEEGKWRKLPEKFFNGKDSSNLLIRGGGAFDSLGNFWVNGHSLYGFINGEWKEYYVNDEFRDARQYLQIVADCHNNLWLTTLVNDKKRKIQFAEIYKFEEGKFHLIWKTDFVVAFWGNGSTEFGCILKTMAALPDCSIVIYRNITESYPDYDEKKTPDVVFFNQDGSFEATPILTPSGEEFYNYDKRVSDIYYEKKDKIWFALARRSYQVDGIEKTCCSGISLYENGKWLPFNEENGLFKVAANTYAQICKIVEYQKGKFLLIDKAHIFYMDERYKLIELSWDDILKNSEFFVCHSYYYGEKGERYIGSLSQTDTSYHARYVRFINKILMPDGKIWLLTDVGILIFNPEIISGIAENTRATEYVLYPNPAKEYINIKSDIDYNKYMIYNILGQKVKSGDFSLSGINIGALPTGTYFLRLFLNDNNYILKTFVKK